MPIYCPIPRLEPLGDVALAAECAANWWAEAHNKARQMAHHELEPALEAFRRELWATVAANLETVGVCVLATEDRPTGALLQAARAAGLNCANRNMWPGHAVMVVEPASVVLDFNATLWRMEA